MHLTFYVPMTKLKAVILLVCWSVTPELASAQYLAPRQQSYYNSVDRLAERVAAQASLLRAQSQAAIDLQQARVIRAQAVRAEIANSVARVKANWEKRATGEEERRKRQFDYLKSKRLINLKTWDRLQNHPDLNGPAIANGRALNFLLDRLTSSGLADFSKEMRSPFGSDDDRLKLSPETLHSLSLRQRLPNGRQLIFRADDSARINLDWWPSALRGEDFVEARNQFETQRNRVVEEARRATISNPSLIALDEAFHRLDAEFRRTYNRSARHRRGTTLWQVYNEADSFLKERAAEISHLKSAGDIDQLGWTVDLADKDNNGNLVPLLQYMSRNGLDFAPARPADIAAYHQVFAGMQALYVGVAADDKGLPRNETQQDAVVSSRQEQGIALARQQDWKGAEAEFRQGIMQSPENHYLYYLQACALLSDGDTDGYRSVCRQMLSRFRDNVGEPVYFTVLTIAMAPAALDDYSEVIRLAREHLTPTILSHRLALGAIALRAGQWGEAERLLIDVPNGRGYQSTLSHYYLAMAELHLGDQAAAAAELDEAVRWTDDALAAEPTITLNWNQQLTVRLLQAEANTVLMANGKKLEKN